MFVQIEEEPGKPPLTREYVVDFQGDILESANGLYPPIAVMINFFM